jgi:hypothetical protein
MREKLLAATVFALVFMGSLTAAEPAKVMLELHSGVLAPGIPLAESDKGAYEIRLVAQVDKAGEGKGSLVLDPNAPVYDEFGFLNPGGSLPPVKLDCTLKFVKKSKIKFTGPRAREEEWLLFEIKGPKITSKLFLTIPAEGPRTTYGRIMVQGPDGKVKYAIGVTTPPPPEPCHPGCFPAGTPILVSDGTKPIERIREGDLITTVGSDGTISQSKVATVFTTKNRLLEVRTDAGNLVTTQTQPLALAGGDLRAAGELKEGDRICRWEGGERRTVTVRSVLPTGREEQVFNLILGEPVLFVANGFLARSKPPAVEAAPE